MKKFLLSLLICAGAIGASAQSVMVDSLSAYIKNSKDDTVRVSVMNANSSNFERLRSAVATSGKLVSLTLEPNRYFSLIPKQGLANCSNLVSVSIPSGVSLIQPMAFLGCTALDSVAMSDDVVEIGNSAFNGCKSLRGVKLPNYLRFISPGTFMETGLERIVIPASVREIGEAAFNRCFGLVQVDFLGRPELLCDPDIREYPFVNCSDDLVIRVDSKLLDDFRKRYADYKFEAL